MKIGADGKPQFSPYKDEDDKNGKNAEKEDIRRKTKKDGKNASFKDKFENYWYFYKWQTIISALILSVIVISSFQLFSKVKPDAFIMYVGPPNLTVKVKNTMSLTAEEYLTDYNGDGKKKLGLVDITAVNPEGVKLTAYETNIEAARRFNTEIATGDSLIYILEESFYDQAAGSGALAAISSLVGDTEVKKIDSFGVKVGTLKFFNLPGFDSFPKDAILCMRDSPDENSPNYGRTKDYWDANKDFFINILTYTGEDSSN